MMGEIWRDIDGFDGLYQISNHGRVKSFKRYREGRILKPHHNNKGYKIISLYKNAKGIHRLVHRLVAEAFLPNPHNLSEVDHVDENKDNNCFSNLTWCDRVYNNTRGIQSKDGRRKTSLHRMRAVGQYTLEGSLLKTYEGVRIAEEKTGVDNRNIIKNCKGKVKTAGGYIWRYLDE